MNQYNRFISLHSMRWPVFGSRYFQTKKAINKNYLSNLLDHEESKLTNKWISIKSHRNRLLMKVNENVRKSYLLVSFLAKHQFHWFILLYTMNENNSFFITSLIIAVLFRNVMANIRKLSFSSKFLVYSSDKVPNIVHFNKN